MLKILCPVNKFRLMVGSAYLDSISKFTRFLVWALNKGYDPQKIADAIELRQDIVDGEIEYLESINYLKKITGRYSFTKAGTEFLKLVKILSDFNAEEHLAQVNMFTGKFSEVSINFLSEGCDCRYQQIRKTIIPGLLRNNNYGGSREYVFSKFKAFFEDLNDEQKDSLYVTIIEKGRGFVPYSLNDYPKWDKNMQKKDGHLSLLLKRPIYVYRTEFQDKLTQEIYGLYLSKPSMTKLEFVLRIGRILQRATIDTRLKIANVIWEMFRRNIGRKTYYDGCTGKVLLQLPENSHVDENKFKKIILNCECQQFTPETKQIVVEVDGHNYSAMTGYRYIEQQDRLQWVDFDSFKECSLNGDNGN